MKHLTTQEAMDELGLKKTMLHYHIRTGRLRTRRIGRLIYVDPASVEQFKDDREAGLIRRGRPKQVKA